MAQHSNTLTVKLSICHHRRFQYNDSNAWCKHRDMGTSALQCRKSGIALLLTKANQSLHAGHAGTVIRIGILGTLFNQHHQTATAAHYCFHMFQVFFSYVYQIQLLSTPRVARLITKYLHAHFRQLANCHKECLEFCHAWTLKIPSPRHCSKMRKASKSEWRCIFSTLWEWRTTGQVQKSKGESINPIAITILERCSTTSRKTWWGRRRL